MSYAVSELLFIAPRYIGFLCNWQSGLRESTKLGACLWLSRYVFRLLTYTNWSDSKIDEEIGVESR